MAAEEKKGILQGVGSNVVALGVVSFLTDVSSEMIFPLLPVFITTILGAGQAALGLIEGIADSTASIIEVFSGYFSDKTGKRKQFVMFGYSLSSLVKVGIALSNQWWQMLIMRGAERIGKGIRESPRDAIIASSTAPDARGKAYGLHRAMDTLGAIVGPVIAYFILLWYGQAEPGYRTVFFAAIIPAVIAVLVLFLFVREPEKAKPAVNKTPFWESLKQMSPN
jgi:MFS family permease